MVWEGRSSQVKSVWSVSSGQICLLGQCEDSVLDQFAGSSQDSVLGQCQCQCQCQFAGSGNYGTIYCLCDIRLSV